ncbi:MAG: sigma-54 dependent transcriptional regulator [Pseudomonadota bacterium]
MHDVILIDDEDDVRQSYEQSLRLADLSVAGFASAQDALAHITYGFRGVVITDIRMPEYDGLQLMRDIGAIDPDLPVILVTGHGDVPMAVGAMREGAYDFLEKPFPSDALIASAERALEKRRLVVENRDLRAQLEAGEQLSARIVGTSDQAARLRADVTAVAATDADVLIHGETGVGKELVARAIHDLGDRREHPFVALNCGALPETLIESELLGHEPGAFTGAVKQRIGKFEHASGGTIFLDEIESMPLEAQVRLLRILQERTITRLGSNREIPIDVRIIAATKTDLRAAADAGTFREDLYYRLNVLNLAIQPLRERREDIPLLFQHFADQARVRFKAPPRELQIAQFANLMACDWPGNVRELQNAATRFALGQMPDPDADRGAVPEVSDTETGWLNIQLRRVEAELIRQTLARNHGSLKATYEQLGVSRKALYDKMQRLGLTAKDDG